MLISKFAKDMNGKSVDLKNDEAAYQALCGIKARDREGKCVVANMNGKSTIFMISKDINVDKNNRNWHKVIPLANLPVHADGTPFYESGTVFDVKSTFAELYHEEDSTDYHGAFAGVEMREVFMPVIENPQKSVSNAIEQGLRKQVDFKVEEGRTSDGYAYNTIRILDPDMSETDRDYCKLVVSSGCMETIYSSDGRAKYTVNEEQKREIEAGAAHGKPTRNYYDTLLRAKDEFAARGMDTSEIDEKLAAHSKAMNDEYLEMIHSPDFSIYTYYKAIKKDTGDLVDVYSTQDNMIDPALEADFLDAYSSDEYFVKTIKKSEYEECKEILKQQSENKPHKKSGKKDFSDDIIDTDVIDKNDVIKSVKKDASKDRSSEVDDIINDDISTDKNTPVD